MRIYTKGGDRGETGLIGGRRVGKDHRRIAAYGEVDELNGQIGWLRVAVDDPDVDRFLGTIQSLLFETGAELANPGPREPDDPGVRESDVLSIEREIDRLEADLPPLRRFILPGGCEAAARAQITRSVCRRAERGTVALLREEPGETQIVPLLNRLSDYLFVLSRWLNRRAGTPEPTWSARSGDPPEEELRDRPESID
ncbi:MAG: cob(I)yrinic acid a,c-diamide adenosyltransferase [Candidatus Eisenbacteria bacterium]|nr:cob(I)yrinic acid a,c-diamide adenosyltransferase [Candidatus Latescibacterota bacterium]MBD3301751.1 cob(I)yrinic acid a,c-diamide adenosyltransferase [Candidatus Eisenbacteria bacterium]